MAKKATNKKNKEEALEDILFNCRDSLRGRASLTDKRDMLLTLVFLKFISERYHECCDEIRRENADDPEFAEMLIATKRSAFGEKGVFMLNAKTDWESLKLTEPKGLAVALDDATTNLMRSEERLKNALPAALFVNSGTEGNVIKQVMDEIDKISHKKFKERDLIGHVYEYFLQAFAINANKEDGEFYTPRSIVELIATFIEPFDGTLYDPCCGSGGMFVQCAKFVEQHGGNTLGINVYGQESDPTTYRLAKMNLAVRGLSYNLGDRPASTFTNDQHRGRTFDYIMANPPFNLKKWYDTSLENDVRWKGYGMPPEGNANYAWILHILSKLTPGKGRAGFLLANGTLEDEDTIKIREQLVKNDKIEAIIVLPREMFYATDISVTLWILNENKTGGIENGRKLRNRKGEVLFMDLRSWNSNIYEKKYVKLSLGQIEAAHKIYTDWQTIAEPCNYEQPELYRSVSSATIKENGWSLVPSRYIKFVDRDNIDTEKVFSSFQADAHTLGDKLSSISSEIVDLGNTFDVLLNSIKDAPLVEIGSYIEQRDERNSDDILTLTSVRGIATSKDIIPTKANMEGVSLSSYKIMYPYDIAYVADTSRRGDKISLAHNQSKERFLLSSISTVFYSSNFEELDPTFLYLWFCRPEFDRYARFNSWGSAREAFSWAEMCRVKVPKPSIEIQRAIVNIYKCACRAKEIAEEAAQQLKSICPALMQHIIHS